MLAEDLPRAIAAATSTISALGLSVDDVIVVRDANRLVLRLRPCDVVARVAPMAFQLNAALEVNLAQRLAEAGSPVVTLDPRLEPGVHVCDGFVMNFWTYHDGLPPRLIPSAKYAHALEGLHAGMRQLDIRVPHFTDRVAEAQRVVESEAESPELADADRGFLITTLRRLKQAVGQRGVTEQLLHGEPHPGNLLGSAKELLFIDLETCCRGPVEFDIAHAPEEVGEHYANAHHELVGECRGLILAMVAAWRLQRGDNDPGGRRAGLEILRALREGPPWPALDVISQRLDRS